MQSSANVTSEECEDAFHQPEETQQLFACPASVDTAEYTRTVCTQTRFSTCRVQRATVAFRADTTAVFCRCCCDAQRQNPLLLAMTSSRGGSKTRPPPDRSVSTHRRSSSRASAVGRVEPWSALVRPAPPRPVRALRCGCCPAGESRSPLRHDDANGTSIAGVTDATPNDRCGEKFASRPRLARHVRLL